MSNAYAHASSSLTRTTETGCAVPVSQQKKRATVRRGTSLPASVEHGDPP